MKKIKYLSSLLVLSLSMVLGINIVSAKAYNVGDQVSFDPGDGVIYKWNVLQNSSEESTTLTLILGQNYGSTVAWNSTNKISDGAVVARQALPSKDNWKNTISIRLATAEEIAKEVKGISNWDGTTINGLPSWLYSNPNGSIGYWTASSNNEGAYVINIGGEMTLAPTVNNTTNYGIRPVITIDKNLINNCKTVDGVKVCNENNNISITDTKSNVSLESTGNILADGSIIKVNLVVKDHEDYKNILTRANNRLNDSVSKMMVYNVELLNNNQKVQPNGNVSLKIPVPNDYRTDKMIVYRMEDDKSLTRLPFKVENGNLVITTNHFSNYALVEVNYEGNLETIDCPENEEKTVVPPTTTSDEKQPEEKVENPKTGVGLQYGIIGLILISCSGLYVYTKKYNRFPKIK